jgi:hypothetical protein
MAGLPETGLFGTLVHRYLSSMNMPVIRRRRALSPATALALFWSSFAMSAEPASQVRSFHLDTPPARALPLFTALGERAWAQGWEPEMLSGETQRGSAFRTRHGGREAVWIVTDYRPADGKVSYARLVEGSNIGLVDVRCKPADGGTEVSVRYTLTAVSPQGEALVREFLAPEHYSRMIEDWRSATSAALAAQK